MPDYFVGSWIILVSMEVFRGRIAPAGAETPFRCVLCNRYLLNDEAGSFIQFKPCCEKRETDLDEGAILDVRHEDSRFFDKQETLAAEWFHATRQNRWLEKATAYPADEIPLLHVGTLTSAADILKRNKDGERTVYLYRVSFHDTGTRIHPAIFKDENMWPANVSALQDGLAGYHVFRYINRFEEVGALSLLVDPRRLMVEEVAVFENSEAVNDFTAG